MPPENADRRCAACGQPYPDGTLKRCRGPCGELKPIAEFSKLWGKPIARCRACKSGEYYARKAVHPPQKLCRRCGIPRVLDAFELLPGDTIMRRPDCRVCVERALIARPVPDAEQFEAMRARAETAEQERDAFRAEVEALRRAPR